MRSNYCRFDILSLRNSLFLFVCLFIIFGSHRVLADFDETTLNKAIDRAGLQRMLTQRMLKSYCQLGQDQFYIKPDEKLSEALSRYEEGLNFLIDYKSIAGVEKSLDSINAIWPEYKELITATANKNNVPRLVKLNEELLSLSHQIVLNLQKKSGKELGKIVNVAGRQRMLTQRIELFYLLRDWGFDELYYIDRLNKSRKDFAEALIYLDNYPKNTNEIKLLLAKAKKSFHLFEHSLDDKNNAFLVSLTVGQLLGYMKKVTSIYSKM